MNSKSSKMNNSSKKLQQTEDKQLEILKQLLLIQKTQQASSLSTVPDIPRIVIKPLKVYTFSRSNYLSTVITSPVASSGLAFAPFLSSFTNFTDFTELFEQYRFAQLTFQFVPVNGITEGVNNVPIYTWIDPDDDTTPLSPQEGLQTQTLKITPQGQYFERTFTPYVSQGSVANGFTGGFSTPSNRLWIDQASSSVKYYGLKYSIPAATGLPAGTPLWDVNVTAIIQCRRPR